MATTLDRIESLEKDITSIRDMLGTLTSGIKAVQDVSQLNERIERFEGTLNRVFVTSYQTHQGHQEIVQTMEYLQDLITAVAEAANLQANQIRQALNNVRASKERQKMEILLTQGVISSTEAVTETSVIAVSEVFTLADGTTVNESPFKTIELGSNVLTDEVKATVLGKTVGDTFSVTYDDGVLTCKIEAIYAINQTSNQTNTEDTSA